MISGFKFVRISSIIYRSWLVVCAPAVRVWAIGFADSFDFSVSSKAGFSYFDHRHHVIRTNIR
ncbi:hypothetical protein X975_00256, partial [Stegodyphus mimosarum]